MVEQWHKDGRRVEHWWWNSGTEMVEQWDSDGRTVKERWWNSGTVMVKQWDRDDRIVEQRWCNSGTVIVEQWNRYAGTVQQGWWNSGTEMKEEWNNNGYLSITPDRMAERSMALHSGCSLLMSPWVRILLLKLFRFPYCFRNWLSPEAG